MQMLVLLFVDFNLKGRLNLPFALRIAGCMARRRTAVPFLPL